MEQKIVTQTCVLSLSTLMYFFDAQIALGEAIHSETCSLFSGRLHFCTRQYNYIFKVIVWHDRNFLNYVLNWKYLIANTPAASVN